MTSANSSLMSVDFSWRNLGNTIAWRRSFTDTQITLWWGQHLGLRINRSYQENTNHDLEHQTTKTVWRDSNGFVARFMPTVLPYYPTAREGSWLVLRSLGWHIFSFDGRVERWSGWLCSAHNVYLASIATENMTLCFNFTSHKYNVNLYLFSRQSDSCYRPRTKILYWNIKKLVAQSPSPFLHKTTFNFL